MSASEARWTFAVGDDDFEEKVLARSRSLPVVVDFWAEWCGPCRTLAPVLERLVEARGGEVELAKVNVDGAPGLAMGFQVQSIPMVVAFRDGKPVDQFLGVLPEAEIEAFLDRLRPTEAESLVQEAAALESDDPERAVEIYRRALASDGRSEAAQLGLARVLVAQGRDAEAATLLEQLGPGGESKEEVDRLRAILALRERALASGDEAAIRARLDAAPDDPRAALELGCLRAVAGEYAEALELLLDAAGRDKKFARDEVRPVMVDVFYVVGARSELADSYRQRLTALMY